VAKAAIGAQQLYVQGSDLSGDVGAVNTIASPRGVQVVTGVNKIALERVLLPSDGEIEFANWFNDAAGAAHPILSALPTSDVVLLWLSGGAIDDPACGLVAKQIDYAWNRGADGAVAGTVPARAAAGTPVEWLVALTAGEDTHASASSSASKDDGASAVTTQGLVAYLQLREIDSGTPTITIEDSANDSAWATLISFTAVAAGAEPTAERKQVTGTANRYLRVTSTGTFVNADFAIAYRRGESYDDVDKS